MAIPVITPNQRLDVFVERAPDGARQRLTTYTGVIQLGMRTSVLGAPAWGPLTTFEHAWLLPDSLPYRADRLGSSSVSATLSPQSMRDTFDLRGLAAGLAPDPDQVHAWLKFDFSVAAHAGTTATYRIEVMVAPDAVHEAAP